MDNLLKMQILETFQRVPKVLPGLVLVQRGLRRQFEHGPESACVMISNRIHVPSFDQLEDHVEVLLGWIVKNMKNADVLMQ